MPSNYKQQGDSFLPSPIGSKTLDKKDQSRRDMWNIEVGIAVKNSSINRGFIPQEIEQSTHS